jgi:hypothetical protein
VSLVRTSLLCCALFLAALAGAPSLEEGAAPAASTPTAAPAGASCRKHGCGCPHERALEACCCTGDAAAPVVAKPRAAPGSEPAPEIVVTRGDGRSPAAVFVPFRCAGGSRSSGDTPACTGTLAEPSRAPAVAPAPFAWQVWPTSRPPCEPFSEPLTPPPRGAGLESMV